MNFLASLSLKAFVDNPIPRFLLGIKPDTELSDNLALQFKDPLPGWAILLIVLPAVALVAMAYYKESNNAGKWSKLIMGLMRIIVLGLLLVIYMQPTLQSVQSKEFESTIFIMVDKSLSMDFTDPNLPTETTDRIAAAIGETSEKIQSMKRMDLAKKALAGDSAKFIRELEKDGVVKIVLFNGSEIKYDVVSPAAEDPSERGAEYARAINAIKPDGKETNIPQAMLDLLDQARSDHNIAAIILITDGRNAIAGSTKPMEAASNRLSEELSKKANKNISILPFLVGDTSLPQDLIARGIEGPSKVSKDSLIRIDVNITQVQYAQDEFYVQLYVTNVADAKGGRKAVKDAREKVTMTKMIGKRDTKPIRVTFEVKPEGVGSWLYSAAIEGAPKSEADKTNNITDPGLYVDVTKRKLKVLIVEGAPRWQYRMMKNTLIRADKEFVVWCMLLEADPNFPQEHTIGKYTDEHGVEGLEIESLKEFPGLEKTDFTQVSLNDFDVIIWGDVDPELESAERGFNKQSLENVARWVQTGRAEKGGEAAARGGSIICLLGEQHFPGAYNTSSDPAVREFVSMLPFKIPREEKDEEDLFGKQEETFRYNLTDDGEDCEVFRFYRNPEDNRKFWSGDGTGGNLSLPGSYKFYPIEDKMDRARVYLEHSTKKNDAGRPYPLIFSSSAVGGKVFGVAIDDTYLWREVKDEIFSLFWIKLVKAAASSDSTQKRFSITTDKEKYVKGKKERVEIKATVLDANAKPQQGLASIVVCYRRINTEKRGEKPDREREEAAGMREIVEVKLEAVVETDPKTDREVMSGDFAGKIDTEKLPAGSYSLWIKKEYTKEGLRAEKVATHFSVRRIEAEKVEGTATSEMLDNLARFGTPKGVRPKARDLSYLKDAIGAYKAPKETDEIATSSIPIWAAWITLILALLVLCIEWVLRKLRRLI